jgi:hypothetical protein
MAGEFCPNCGGGLAAALTSSPQAANQPRTQLCMKRRYSTVGRSRLASLRIAVWPG